VSTILKILLAGGSGFIGKHLIKNWRENSHFVILLSRDCSNNTNFANDCITWDYLKEHHDILSGVDVVVNLAGTNIATIWTKKQKEKILNSRINATKELVNIINSLNDRPKLFINASAIGIYGNSEIEHFTENSKLASNFLAQVVKKWEEEVQKVTIPEVRLRLGVVLGDDGGVYPKISLPFRLLLGGKVGSGKQWMSWIHVADVVGIINFLIENPHINGAINLTSPNPVTNEEFSKALAKVLNVPYWLTTPAFLLRLLLGEMSQIIIEGQYVIPARLLESGYKFKYINIVDALKSLKN